MAYLMEVCSGTLDASLTAIERVCPVFQDTWLDEQLSRLCIHFAFEARRRRGGES